MKHTVNVTAAMVLVGLVSMATNLFAAILTVSNVNDSGPGSLRAAIDAANQTPGPDTIVFNIPASDPGFDGQVFTINPLSALPSLTDANTTIDGATQTAFTGDTNPAGPEVVLNGSQVGFVGGGLAINSSGNIINSLVLNGFNNTGIDINGAGATFNTVTGCYLGTNPTGDSAVPNTFDGMALRAGASNNTIGGSSSSELNLISGNTRNGITIQDITVGSGANNNVVQGNFIGTNAAGQSALGNGGFGVQIGTAANGNLVGGTTPGARNVISGNGQFGVLLVTGNDIANNLIEGNFIGTDLSGTLSVGNQFGVGLFSTSSNTIGGTTAGMQNVISGNFSSGIQCSGCSNQVIQGNFIGTNAAGSAAIPNAEGIAVFQGAQNNTIGGTVAGAPNVISGNTGNGVTVSDSGTNGNAILSNSIYDNGGLGIDLGGDGVTPNDTNDTDAGPNNLQNYPVLTSITISQSNINIVGTLNSVANTTFRLEFFESAADDPSGFNEGQFFLGSSDVATDGSGDASFDLNFPLGPGVGRITATATDPNGNTSEFSATPVITSPLVATGTVGLPFSYQFEATGATSLGVDESTLPPGLTFDSTLRAILGNPTVEGTFQIGLSASNLAGTTNANLILTVQPLPASGPVIISITSATGRTGSPFDFQVITMGGTSAARLSATGLPPGLSVDPVTGEISGTPTSDGSFSVTLTVTEGSLTTTATLQLTFTSDPAVPVIVSANSAFLFPDQFFSYTIVAPTSDSSDPVTYAAIPPLPPGLGLDPDTGIISGTFQSRLGSQPGPQLSGGVITNVQLFATNSTGTGTIPLLFLLAPSGAVNISTRLAVGTSDDVLIGGFIITGNAPKKVLIRGIGPSLEASGVPVPGRLLDPTLELQDKDGALGLNDNWRDSQEQAIIDTTIPPTDDRESAIVATLAAKDPNIEHSGEYTVTLSGKNDTTGVALVEVYDLGTASLDISSQAQLANISTRGKVQTGDNVMIGGFIVGGSTASNILVRAIGPELTAQGVAGALQDTALELHDGTGTLLTSNDDWESTQKQQIIDTTIPPTDSRESAIVATLNPGNYTAILRGKNNTTGVALVEAYVLP